MIHREGRKVAFPIPRAQIFAPHRLNLMLWAPRVVQIRAAHVESSLGHIGIEKNSTVTFCFVISCLQEDVSRASDTSWLSSFVVQFSSKRLSEGMLQTVSRLGPRTPVVMISLVCSYC